MELIDHARTTHFSLPDRARAIRISGLLDKVRNPTRLFVDRVKLPLPCVIVEEWSMVEPVVVGTVRLCVTRRREDGHFVSIDRVTPVEVFHLVRHLQGNPYFQCNCRYVSV